MNHDCLLYLLLDAQTHTLQGKLLTSGSQEKCSLETKKWLSFITRAQNCHHTEMFTVQVSSAKFCSVSLLLLLLKFIFLGGFDTEFDYNEVFILVFYHLFHITQIPQEHKVFENLGKRNLIPYVPSFFSAGDV